MKENNISLGDLKEAQKSDIVFKKKKIPEKQNSNES